MRRSARAVLAALLALELVAPAARAFAQAATPFPVVPAESSSPRRHTWAYLSLLSGAALIGVSFVYADRADDAYAAYLVSTDQEEIPVLYDRAVHNDHLAQASLITGEVLVAAGLYLRFIRRPAPRRVSMSMGLSRCAVTWRF